MNPREAKRKALYLKRQHIHNTWHYLLSESYWNGGCWTHRRLMDLGASPGKYIEYPGGNSFYINEELLEDLQAMGKGDTSDELEDLLKPFLDPRIRRIIERFERTKNPVKHWRESYSKESLLEFQRNLHTFDKRRIHYLRFGRVHIGDLDARPRSFLYILFEKSRDEIEHLIEEMEAALPPHELGPYLYTALRLQDHFSHLLTRYHPSAMDPEKLDRYFIEALCRLNRDPQFFKGVDHPDTASLHVYLVKYIIFYFDNAFRAGPAVDEDIEDFVWKHRFYKKPGATAATRPAERAACQSLGISPGDFQQMDRATLTRCYRRLAKETHPDRGGDNTRFLEVKEAYERLVAKK